MITISFKSKFKSFLNRYPSLYLIRSTFYEKFNFIYKFYINKKLNNIQIKKNIINKNNKKKILLVTDQIKPGGSERQLLRLASNLIKKDFDVLIINLVLYEKNWRKNLNFYRSQISNKIQVKTIDLSNIDNIQAKNQLEFTYKKKYKIFSEQEFLGFFNYKEKILFYKFYEILNEFKP